MNRVAEAYTTPRVETQPRPWLWPLMASVLVVALCSWWVYRASTRTAQYQRWGHAVLNYQSQ